jgi:hypothetical protein
MTPVMPILIGAPNEQCRNPEVTAVFGCVESKMPNVARYRRWQLSYRNLHFTWVLLAE